MYLSSYKFSLEIHSPGEDQLLCVAEILQGPCGFLGEKGLVGPSTRPASPLPRASNNKHPMSPVSPPLKRGHYLGNFCQSHLFEDFPLKASSVPSSGEAQPRGDLSNLPHLSRNRWAPGGGPPPSSSAVCRERGLGWKPCELPRLEPWGPHICTFLEPLHTVLVSSTEGQGPPVVIRTHPVCDPLLLFKPCSSH